MRILTTTILVALSAAVPNHAREAGSDATSPRNVLLFLLDDVGRDKIGCYGISDEAGPTPVIDELAARGVRFDAAWATPYCSPTRATIVTGRHAGRTGIGKVINYLDRKPPGMSLDEWTIAEAARERAGARSALTGKWHLADASQGLDHPRASGFDYFAGTMRNLGGRRDNGAYLRPAWVENGLPVPNDRYATTRAVDDAMSFIADHEGDPERRDAPWFVAVSFHGAHYPLHAPPSELHTFELSGVPMKSAAQHHRAMVQAIDTEIGRMLRSMDEATLERTTVIVVGDNGTQNSCLGPPLRKGTGKGTMHEGGVGVPLIVTGAGVAAPGRASAALVHTVDLFPTIVEWLGGEVTEAPNAIDGVSFAPVLSSADSEGPREVVFTEWFEPNHVGPDERERWFRAVREGDHKLIVPLSGAAELYDLASDPFEERDLIAAGDEAAAEIAARLRAELDRIQASFEEPALTRAR